MKNNVLTTVLLSLMAFYLTNISAMQEVSPEVQRQKAAFQRRLNHSFLSRHAEKIVVASFALTYAYIIYCADPESCSRELMSEKWHQFTMYIQSLNLGEWGLALIVSVREKLASYHESDCSGLGCPF